ncbi:MAG: hypothetical protein IPN97_12335 [Saprospiraceae bacterium]|nr:hypothetical protein [Saprospiraceae bacterium]
MDDGCAFTNRFVGINRFCRFNHCYEQYSGQYHCKFSFKYQFICGDYQRVFFAVLPLLAGNVNIGTTTGNTIGATTGVDNISKSSNDCRWDQPI